MKEAAASEVGTAPLPLDRSRFLGLAMIALMAVELLAGMTGAAGLRAAAGLAAAAVVVLAWRSLGLREGYLLGLCALLSAFVAFRGEAVGPTLIAAVDQAAFLMAFILLLGLLHEAAATSPSVASCGRYLTRQPPGRRYYALYAGTGAMAVLFNIGVVSFLVPLIQRGIHGATPDDPLNPVRERRQVTALLRGFAWSVIWSPTAIAPLALMALIPGVDRLLWIGLGFGIFVLVMLLGATEDRLRFRRYQSGAVRAGEPFPARAATMFLAACLWLLGMSVAVAWATGESTVFGLMVSCPVMLVGWLAAQNGPFRRAGLARTAGRLRAIAFGSLPKAAPVAVTLGCSGFVGRLAAALVPAEAVAETLRMEAMPDFVLLSLIPVALSLLSLLALSPIMMAVFFGSLFGSLAVPPADPTLIALAISCGWALSMTFSPFATVVLMTNRVGGIRPITLTWGWNLAYSLLAALALVPVFAVLTGGG